MLRWNNTYHTKESDVMTVFWLIKSKDKLYQRIEKLSLLLARSEALFIIDDIIADKRPDK